MIQLTHASVFSGIGAPEIAAEMLGWQNLFHCEINPFGRSILDYYFPNSKSYEDIKKTDFSEWRGKIDILTGGFPCQPFSYAGKRKGAKDDRYLWKYMLRCVQQVQPTWFIGENVVGITTMVFHNNGVKVASDADLFGDGNNIYRRNERYVLNEICENLEQEGYSVQPLLIPACAVQAPHRRDRIWIIAHRDAVLAPNTNGSNNERGESGEIQGTEKEERICQRNDIRQFEQSNNVQSKVQGLITNTASGRDTTQEQSGQTERDRSNGLSQQSERSYETERTNGLPTLQRYVTDTEGEQSNRDKFKQREYGESKSPQFRRESSENSNYLLPENRWRAFPTQSPIYRGDDGFPLDVDNLTIPYLKSKKKKDHFSEWKKESLKAYGNAWVVQVGYEIMRAIGEIETNINNI